MRKDTYQDCLILYPESAWNVQMNELRSRLNRWNPKHQMIFRQFVSDVEIITLDANGRFLIPKRYQKLAGIVQEVRFIGMDDTIEIWSKEAADQPFMKPEEFEAKQWIDAVINDTDPVVLPRQALVVSQILEAIYVSDKTGKPVYFE